MKKYFWKLEPKKLIFRSEILTYPLILRMIKNLREKNLRILDAGCGTGKLARGLASLGFETYGIDNSKSSIALAKQENGKIQYKVGNVETLTKIYKKEFFDIIISTFVTLYCNLIFGFKKIK